VSLQLFKKFAQPETDYSDDSMGSKRDYNCDLIPKFVMAKGLLVKILLHTRTTHYLDFAKVGGSYVMAKSVVNKVPATAQEAMSSNLMGLFEKRRMKKLLDYAFTFDPADPATFAGKDNNVQTMQQTFDEYSLEASTATFIGHSISLYTTDEYLAKPSAPCLEKMKLYAESMMQYGDSPFIYPLYGLGDLPQAFARLSAVFGGTFMLDTPFKGIVTDDDGELCGINSTVNGKECLLKCKSIFASPDYFPDKVEKKGDIARCYWCVSPPHRIEAMPNVPHTVASVAGRQPSRRGRLQGCRLLACIRLENNKKEKKVRS
jgi:Rab GDP dissociation inhibitor